MAKVTLQRQSTGRKRVADVPHGTLGLYWGQVYLVHGSSGLRQAVRLDGTAFLNADAVIEILPKGETVTLEQEAV